MLNKLTVKNVALIESAEIDFTKGFNVLSGETGSGKSVILESLNFVLGAKADKTLIRNGAEECAVSAEFDIEGCTAVCNILDEFGFDKDDVLLITRRFNLSGKNTVKINGNSATVSMVKRLTDNLIDVHGQSEHFYLLSSTNQLKLIDKFTASDENGLLTKIKELHDKYKELNKEFTAAGGDEASRLLRLDVLNYQIKEIENAEIKESEFEELTALKEKLLHREKIVSALNAVKSGIEDEGGVSDVLSNAVRTLNGISGLGDEYSDVAERLNGAYAEIDDVLSSVASLLDDLGYSEYSIDEVEERLGRIKNLFKKYGGSFDGVQEFLKTAKAEEEKLENFNVYAANLQNEIFKIQKELYELYTDLSEKRRSSAKIFAENVQAELKELGMTKARFYVDFAEIPSFENCKFDSANGIDTVKFMFSANSGEQPKPLSDIISGGEMSRFMLSVKAQTAKYNEISTFIFDEIDAGISGEIAWVVAKKLALISCSVQVIAVSHLPQIASFADNNILILKTEFADKTVTSVKTLDNDGKIAEIVRLSGGVMDSAFAVEHAKTLIAKARDFKTMLG